MSTRASAARYARALLDVVIKDGNPEQVEQQLSGLATLYTQTPELQKALTHPAVPVSAKRGVIENLSARLALVPPLARLLLMLTDRERLALLPELAEVYRERLRTHRGVIQAELTTAEPLAADRAAQLEARLSKATGRTVTISTKVDPGLIGGAVARVGSTVFDGSIATQLRRMRERLT